MVYATRIRMKPSYSSASVYYSLENLLLEIDEIYLTGVTREGWYKKAQVHDLINEGHVVSVNIPPYPKLIALVSTRTHEKYVRSISNDSTKDNLLSLPRG